MLSNPEKTDSQILCEVKNLDAIDKKLRDAEEIDEKQILIRAQTRNRQIGNVIDPDPEWHPLSNEDFDKCRQPIFDVKCKHTYDRMNSRISFASMSAEKVQFLGELGNLPLNQIVVKILKKVTKIFTDRQFQVSTQNAEHAEFQNTIKSETERVRVFLVEKDLQKKQLKRPPERLPAFDANNLETYIALPAEDVLRSKENMMLKVAVNRLKIEEITKVTDILKKDLEQLESEKQPLVKDLTKGLKENASKETLKDLKWEIEILNDRIQLKFDELSTMKVEEDGLLADIETAEKKIGVLNLVLDNYEIPGKIDNLGKRRKKLTDRIHSFLDDIESIETYRNNINSEWKRLVGTEKDICLPANLMASANIYII